MILAPAGRPPSSTPLCWLPAPWVTALAIVLMAAAPTRQAAEASRVVVERIRTWTGAKHTRIVLDLSAQVTFHRTETADPPATIIELEGCRFEAGVNDLAIRDGRVHGIRLLPPDALPAQVVIDLAGQRDVKVFALPPGDGKPHRLVIDVLGQPAPGEAVSPSRAPGDPGTPAQRERPWIIVVDPGHGGRDPGAKGPGGIKEKDVCLALAKALASELNRRPGYKAYLTRDTDVFLHLRQRTRIAAEKKADLFVSIHANSSRNKRARGTEVFFLSLRGASDESAREVAMRENAADHVGDVPPESQEEIENILVDLLQTSALERSSELAVTIVERLREHRDLELRGVKQAGFDVLKTAGMPSILVETAFISNARESKLLASSGFQRRFASLMTSGIGDFLDRAAATEIPAAATRTGTGQPAGASPGGAPPAPAGS